MLVWAIEVCPELSIRLWIYRVLVDPEMGP
jgi:hypothetical protein